MHILGVDIGGTFTDFVVLHNGTITIHKQPTTPDDPSRALLAGVATCGTPDVLIHGTTIATNALLERRGGRTALLTTAGFTDVLVIGRGTRPALYDIAPPHMPPLIPATQRIGIPERIAADGSLVVPLDERAVVAAAEQLMMADVESVAVVLLHSYRNPTHEQRVATLLATVMSSIPTSNSRPFFISCSSDIMPEYREYERTSTTVVNAYVAPVLDRYLDTIEQSLHHQRSHTGAPPTLRIMASDGGSMTAHGARRLAARTTLSGPAGGVVGARAVALQAGYERIISFDMGGTSTDVALCDGKVPQTTQSSVGGFPVRFPAIDIHTVGAGGGSLARQDAGGNLRVGPQSAGADPGPACYGRGELPTVTDANLLLGRLRPDYFLGGTMPLDLERAEAVILLLAETMGLDAETTALGIVRVANAAMERAIRAISVERGIDPRDFTLVAFGGAGPLHAVHLADALHMPRVLIPRYPGVLSALGMLTANMSNDYSAFLALPLAHESTDTLMDTLHTLAQYAQHDMARDIADTTAINTTALRGIFSLDVRYKGQSHEINTPLVIWEHMHPQVPNMADVAQQFHTLHLQQSGHTLPEQPMEMVCVRLKCVAPMHHIHIPHMSTTIALPSHTPHAIATVSAILDNSSGSEQPLPMPTALFAREQLQPGDVLCAPAIIVQHDTTTIIPSGWVGHVDAHEHIIIEQRTTSHRIHNT